MNSTLASVETNPEPGPNGIHSELEAKLVEALKKVYDPEIPIDIYELGLIYGMKLDQDGTLHIRMTLTAPGCPVADSILAEVRARVLEIEDIHEAEVELAWDPPWSPDRMSEAARLTLNF